MADDADIDSADLTATDRGYLARETYHALGAGARLSNGLELPEPTLADLPLLDQIGSPYLTDGKPVAQDVLAAAFICCEGRAARLILARAEHAAAQGAERVAEPFLIAVDAWAREHLRGLPYPELKEAIERQLCGSYGGFEMLPTMPGGSKKNWMPPGLRSAWQRLARFATIPRRLFSRCRSHSPGTSTRNPRPAVE